MTESLCPLCPEKTDQTKSSNCNKSAVSVQYSCFSLVLENVVAFLTKKKNNFLEPGCAVHRLHRNSSVYFSSGK